AVLDGDICVAERSAGAVEHLPACEDDSHGTRPSLPVFLGTSRNGMSRSTCGSLGRPRTCSPMMLRWISSVPPAIDTAGTETSTSVTMPARGESAPANMADAPETSVCTPAAARAMLLALKLL